MQCPRCQAINDDGAAFCSRCGSPFGATAPAGSPYPRGGAPITDYLVWSILVTIFCCWPLGIPAIINASKANKLAAAGDLMGAQSASDKAKTFIWIAFGLGLLVGLIYLIIVVAAVMDEMF